MKNTIRNSKQRQLVLDAVRSFRGHPSAEAVYAYLKANNPALSLGTVYRNLSILTRLGEINKVDVSMPCERYDGNCVPHHHLLCEVCGELHDVGDAHIGELLSSLPETMDGHQINGIHVIYTGRCAHCRRKEREASEKNEQSEDRDCGEESDEDDA